MKKQIYILVVEDEAEVLDVIVRDIGFFEDCFPIEVASSAEEARQIIEEVLGEGGRFGLFLCDHILPGENGVDLLIDLQRREATKSSKKVLITGQAGLEDTVRAVNRADLDHYIAKPWDEKELQNTVRRELTDFLLEQQINPLPYMQLLEADRIAEAIRNNKAITDR